MKEQRGATEQVDAPLLIHPGKNHLDSLTLTKTAYSWSSSDDCQVSGIVSRFLSQTPIVR